MLEVNLETAIARLEEKQDAQIHMLKEFINSQKAHNASFYKTRDEVIRMQANARGAWWMLGVLGVMVSTAVSWIVAALKS